MKNIRIYSLLLIICLLGWLPFAAIAQGVVIGTVTLNDETIPAEYYFTGEVAYLGSGNNACIPQYSEGKVEVPATIIVDNETYPVQEVSNVAFRMCSKITEVILPENIHYIGNFAFQGCQALEKVALPSTLYDIGSGAFIDLPNLTTIDLKAEMPPVWYYNDVFKFHTGGIGDQATYTYDIQLLVPEGSVNSYMSRYYSDNSLGWTKPEGWANFTNIDVGASVNAEAYATFNNNGTLTFYYDAHRTDRQNNGLLTFGLAPDASGFPEWLTPLHNHANAITKVEFTPLFQYARPVTTARWFNGCVNLNAIIGMDHLRTDAVTDMSYMFHGCSSLENDDFEFSGFNTASVSTMRSMFEGCTGITQLDLSHFDTRSCTSMENMFWGCTNLISIDLSSFETTACNFNYMFSGCTNLEEVSIGSLGMGNGYCTCMFEGCGKLKSLVIPSSLSTSVNMFSGCTHLYDVYCYKPLPFEVWQGRENDFDTNTQYYTRFHVLASTLDAWLAAYGPETATPANVTFIGDLGTDTNPILIYSTVDWLNIGLMADNDLSINAMMMNDINVTTALGSPAHPFKGIFDGNGHTLTVNYENINVDYPAPFSVIQNATINNLKVVGNITFTDTKSAAGGLVGHCQKVSDSEASSNTITNCLVSTTITGKTKHFGGVIGTIDANVNTTMNGCLFDGGLNADHDYYISNTILAGTMVCTAGDANRLSVSNYVEHGTSYQNISSGELRFCPNSVNPANSYFITPEMGGNAKRAYSLTTDTEGLLLDYGTPTATYDVSGITAYGTGLKIGDVFHAATNEPINVAITAPGYEYSINNLTISGDASLSTSDDAHYTVTLHDANAIISLPGMVFTTIVLYDDATDNTLTLENYLDQTYKVKLMGHTISHTYQWNPLCLPFDLTRQQVEASPLANTKLMALDTITFENKVAIYHFKDTTAITADRPYLVQIRSGQDIVDPVFNNVTIKRSMPPGMKVDVGDLTYSGFVVEGNYNQTHLRDISGTGESYTAFYFDRAALRRITEATTMNAFHFFLEVCLNINDVVAVALDLDGNTNYLTLLDERYSDVDNIFFRQGDWDESENWVNGVVPNIASKVLIESHATIPAGCVAEAEKIIVDEGSIRIKDGGQLVHNSWGLQANVEKTFNPYYSNQNPGGYYLITNPVEEAQDPEYLNNMVADYGSNDYDLYYFNQSEQLEWRNYKEVPFDLENGIGYLYASQSRRDIEFAGRIRPANAVVNVPVTYDDASFKGFNLIGNPFVCNAYLADGRDFYVLDADGKEVVLPETNSLAPMQGVFVQTTSNEENVTFTTTAPQTSGRALTISLTQGRGTAIDNARIRFDGPSTGSGTGRGLEKFQLDPNHTKVYITQDGKDYAVAVVASNSDAIQQTELPLNFKAAKNGSYTFSFNLENMDLDYLHLIDNLNGTNVDLLAMPTYTFEAKTTDYASRFKLVFVGGDANDDETFAYINNGNIIINEADACGASLQVVDVTGRVVLSGDAMNRVSTSGMTPGVFVLRLINGDSVKTQKIVIE